MDDLYREVIVERYKNPYYKGELNPHDISFEDENPLCGDHIRIDLTVDEQGKITGSGIFPGSLLRTSSECCQRKTYSTFPPV